MAIVVIGGGAIGLLVAGRLHQAGASVALLARPSGVTALHNGGLVLVEAGHETTIPLLPAAATAAALPDAWHTPQLAIVCVKGYDTDSTLPDLAELQPAHILTLQNGIGNEEALAKRFDPSRVLSGVITSSVAVADSAAGGGLRVEVTKAGGLGIAPLLTPAGAPDTQAIVNRWVATFRGAGFDTRAYDDYRTLKWSKALLNMLGNGTAAVLDMPPEAVYADRRLFALERQLVREALNVMHKRGIGTVDLPRYPAALLARAVRWLPVPVLQRVLRRAIAGGRGGKVPSLLGDLQRGRSRSEGAYLYGAVAATARESGVAAPVNQGLWHVLCAIAEGTLPWAHFRNNPQALLDAIRNNGRSI